MNTTTRNQAAPAPAALLQEIGPAVCAELQRINGTLQGELLDGVANIVAGIRRSERPPEDQALAFDAIAASVRELAAEVTALFAEHQASILRVQRDALAATEVCR